MRKKTLLAAAALVFALTACTGHSDGHEAHDGHGDTHDGHEAHGDTHHYGEIVMTAQQVRDGGIATETARRGGFRNVIRVGGELQATAEGEHTIAATADGIVTYTDGAANEGAQLHAGQTVATISARHLQDGDPVEKARIAYETAKGEYERAAVLYDRHVISATEYEGLRERYETARLAYHALAPRHTANGTAVTAAAGGYVKSRMARQGAYVSVGDPLLVVTQTRRLQLRAELPERLAGKMRGVTSANFRCAGDTTTYRLATLNGRLVSYGRSRTDDTFYIPVTFEFDNIGSFIAGAFVEVFLLADVRDGVIAVPNTALTEEQGIHYIYIRKTATKTETVFEKREVTPGATDGTRTEILSGLKGGEEVVTRGAVHVKLAAVTAVPEGHTH